MIRGLGMNALLAITRRTTIPGRLRLADKLSGLLAPPGGFVISRLKNGLVMELDLSDRLQRWLHFLGEYEAATSKLIQDVLRPGDTFLDIGANVGWHTLAGARCVGPEGRVIAFEPMPPNVERIRRNLELNGLHNVLVEEAALSDSEEILELSTSHERSGNATLAPRESARQRFKVRTIRLDDYLDSHGIESVRLIKMDIEGAELRALKGMTRLLERRAAPVVVCEVNPSMLRQLGSSPEALLGFLEDLGYRGAHLDAPDDLRSLGTIPALEGHENIVFTREQAGVPE